MKDLRLSDFLRYLVCGAILVFTIALVRSSNAESLRFTDKGLGEATAFLLVALVLGSILYSIHRAVFFWMLLSCIRQCCLSEVPLNTLTEPASKKSWFRRLIDHESLWDLHLYRGRENNLTGISNLPERADQVHLLYTSSEAIFAGLILDILVVPGGICPTWDWNPNCTALGLVAVGIVVFVIAVCAHWRYVQFEARVLWPNHFEIRLPPRQHE